MSVNLVKYKIEYEIAFRSRAIVLFFGFSVFTISSFGGTVALGALVSITLVFAMLANLLLLPALLLSLEKEIANKKTFKKPSFEILPENQNESKN